LKVNIRAEWIVLTGIPLMKKKKKIQPRISRIHTNTDKHGYFCAGGVKKSFFSCEFVKFVVESFSLLLSFIREIRGESFSVPALPGQD